MKAIRDKAGYSLLETIIALAILAVGVLFVMNLFPIGLQYARTAQERTVAAELAGSRLGELRMAGARSVLVGGVEASKLMTRVSIDLSQRAYTLYEGYYTTTQPMPGSGGTALQRVVFAVEMADGRRETFVTYVSDI